MRFLPFMLLSWVLVPLIMRVAFGDVDPLAMFAFIAFVDVPLLRLYEVAKLHPYVGMPVSIVLGGLVYAAIAYGLFRLRPTSRS